MFDVKVFGTFEIINSNGQIIRPTSRKECALIAVLALSPRMTQTRKWLQTTFWSDRSDTQGAASLRQALSNIRKLFHGTNAIISDRTYVGLNPDLFQCEQAQSCFEPVYNQELLQGLDIYDEAFNEWLRMERQARNPATAKPREQRSLDLVSPVVGPCEILVFEAPVVAEAGPRGEAFSEILIDELCNAAKTIGVRRLITKDINPSNDVGEAYQNATTLRVRTHVTALGENGYVNLRLVDSMNTLLACIRQEVDLNSWANLKKIAFGFSNQFMGHLVDYKSSLLKVDKSNLSAHANACMVLKGIVEPHSVETSVMAACSAYAINASDSGLYRALHGTVELFKFGEQNVGCTAARSQVMEHFRVALSRDPNNALVNALAGHSYSFFMGNIEQGLILTERGARLAPANAFVVAFYALSLGYANKSRLAHETAKKARQLCGASFAHAFIDSVCCYTALLVGDAQMALRYGESSLVFAPNFRATQLDVAACYSLIGQPEKARKWTRHLKQNQPDFSVDLIASPEYPIVNQAHRRVIVEGISRLDIAAH